MYNNVQKIKQKGKEGRKVGLVIESSVIKHAESSVYKLIDKQTNRKHSGHAMRFSHPGKLIRLKIEKYLMQSPGPYYLEEFFVRHNTSKNFVIHRSLFPINITLHIISYHSFHTGSIYSLSKLLIQLDNSMHL